MKTEFEKGFIAGYLLNCNNDTPKPGPNPWTYPNSWLKLPEPADNQIVMLVDNKGGTPSETISYNININLNNDSVSSETKIDWGDETSIDGTFSHTYEPETGHKTTKSEQWIVTITFDKNLETGTEYLNSITLSTIGMFVLAIKIGNTEYVRDAIDCKNSNLQYVKICRGEFNFVFSNISNLYQVELHKKITKIPDKAFYCAYNLIYINLENITEVGARVFYMCINMNFSGKMPKLKTIGEYGLSYTSTSSLDFPSLESIGIYAFAYCFNLKKAICTSEALKTIGRFAFVGCETLQIVDLPYVTEIEQRAFQSCNVLETVNLPLVIKIGAYCFLNNDSLTTVDLRSCTDIGGYLFSGCYSLDHCILPASVDVSDPKIIGQNFNDMVEIEHGEEENVNA